jgi:ATP-binding cassette, subfamily B, bacterial MsbA
MMRGPMMMGGPPRPMDEGQTVRMRQAYGRLLRYARPYWHWAAAVLLLAMVTAAIDVLPMQVLGVAIDEITGFGDESFLSSPESPSLSEGPEAERTPRNTVSIPIAPYLRQAARLVAANVSSDTSRAIILAGVLAGSFLMLFVLSRLFRVLQGFIMAALGQSIVYDIRGQVYAHLQKLSLSYYEDRKTGDLMSRVVNDVNSLEHVIVGPVIGFVTDICRLGLVLYFCLSWNWVLTLLALAASPVLILSTRFFGRILRRNFREQRTRVGELNALAQDNISGIRIIKGFARESHELERFNQKSRENYTVAVRLHRLFAAFRPWVETLNQVGAVVVLGYGSLLVLNGELRPGLLVVFFQYLPMLYRPVTELSRFYNFIQQALASSERVFEVLDTKPQVEDRPDAIVLPRLRGEVEFRSASFGYRRDAIVLHDINLHVRPGQMVALVGPSGAGKSTLVNLILRFYDPVSGEIRVDGHNLRDVDATSLRRQTGIVQQDPFLFNDTVRVNIAYGRLGASEEDIVAAAKAANAHDFIQELPDKYDSVIGERGVKLSGGQRQRLSIARAILADARILVLDEATSSVDSETEHLIQSAIQNLVQNRTTLVIAHRLSTIRHADTIVVLDEGRIVEMGTHSELLESPGLYARLHRMQFRTSPPREETVASPTDADPSGPPGAILDTDGPDGDAFPNLGIHDNSTD